MSQMTRRFGCVALALLAAVFAATSTSAATVSDSNWTIQKLPTPAVAPNGQLMGTSCTSDRFCVAVGVAQDSSGRDTALAERWNGNRWEGQSTPTLRGAVGTFLAGVSCTAPNACTAVGNLENGSGQHVTLAERWNGIDWDIQFTPNPSGATDSFLSGVSCVSAVVCTAVGYSLNGAGQKSTLAERWNGRTWDIQSTPNAGGAPDSMLSSVSCASATSCTTVGKSISNFLAQALIERWNGVSWEVQVAAMPAGASGSALVGVSCSTDSACTAVGNFAAKSTKAGGALAEQWDGATWTIEPSPGTTLDFLNAVSCTTPTACTAVGQTGFSQPIAERWDGSSWLMQVSPSPSDASQTNLVGVSCPTQSACFGIGSALYTSGNGTNLTLAEQWNGTQWAIQTSLNPLGATAHGLVGVSCATPRACMAVGYYFDAFGTSVTLAEEWNGIDWKIRSAPNPVGATGAGFGSVACTTARDCTAVGSYSDSSGLSMTLIERWNGSNWKIQPSANPASTSASFLNGVACVTESLCTAAGGYVDSAGTAQTLIERWNGTVWEIQPTPNPAGAAYVAFNGVACPAARECTAVGFYVDGAFNFLTFAEHWNGTVWDIQVTPNPVGTDGPNGTLEGGVSCVTPRTCTAVGQWSPAPAPHPGVSLAERWNGTSWQVQATPNPAAVDAVNGTHNSPLAGVSCATVNECMAVGNYASGDANGDFLALAERWNGTSWSVQQAATPVGAFYTTLHGVACPTPRTCVAVGDSTRYNAQTNTRGRPVGLAERYLVGDD